MLLRSPKCCWLSHSNCRFIIFTALSVFVSALVLDVQASEQVPGAFAQTVSGARPVALRGAYVAIADDANAIWWNPAGISQLRGSSITSTYASLYNVDGLSMSSLGYAKPTGIGAFGAGVTYLRASDIPITDPNGNIIELLAQSEEVVTLSYGNSLLSNLHFGAGIRYLRSGQVIDCSGFSLDLGLLASPVRRFCFGAMSQQIASYLRVGNGKESQKLPRNIKIAATFNTERVSAGLGLSDLLSSHYRKISAGCEVLPFDYIALRASLQAGMRNQTTASWDAGIGIRLERVQIDYSYMNQPSLASSHLISITFSVTDTILAR
jgi:hypothetical protein